MTLIYWGFCDDILETSIEPNTDYPGTEAYLCCSLGGDTSGSDVKPIKVVIDKNLQDKESGSAPHNSPCPPGYELGHNGVCVEVLGK